MKKKEKFEIQHYKFEYQPHSIVGYGELVLDTTSDCKEDVGGVLWVVSVFCVGGFREYAV